MPDNQSDGTLEDFLRRLIPSADPHWSSAEAAAVQAQERAPTFGMKDLTKAKVRTWAAWQHQPGVLPGEAIANGHLNPRAPLALRFMDWFNLTYPGAARP